MKNKGLSGQDYVELIFIWVFAAVILAIIFFHWRAQLTVEAIVRAHEISVNREINYAQILMSSKELAFSDKNGISKGVLDYNKIKDLKNLNPKKLFEIYSYQKDDIAKENYLHYVKIEIFKNDKGEQKEEAIEFEQEKIGVLASAFIRSPKVGAREFPVAIRHSNGYASLGKLYVNIIPFEPIAPPIE